MTDEKGYFEPGDVIRGAGTPGHGYPTWIPSADHEGRMCHLHLRDIELEPDGRHYRAIIDKLERTHPDLTPAEEISLYGGRP